MFISKNKIQSAFTLMELLLVIFIIGLLITTSVFSVQNYRSKSRDVERVNDIYLIQMALEEYYNKNNSYPATLTELNTGTETYLTEIPLAPVPADGDCTEGENNYEYQFYGKNFYTISFCLGSDVKEISAGKNFASHHGIGKWFCGLDFVDDRDEQSYSTVQIGSQCWMQENMNIGEMIEGSINQSNNSVIEKYCYNNDSSDCDLYGGLYQWNEAMNYVETEGAQGICPDGWHIPTSNDWSSLVSYLSSSSNPQYQCDGNSTYIAKSLASAYGWTSNTTTCAVGDNQSANNATGFNALPAGYRSYINGAFSSIGNYVTFWRSEIYLSNNESAWHSPLLNYHTTFGTSAWYKANGYSVRCLKNN